MKVIYTNGDEEDLTESEIQPLYLTIEQLRDFTRGLPQGAIDDLLLAWFTCLRTCARDRSYANFWTPTTTPIATPKALSRGLWMATHLTTAAATTTVKETLARGMTSVPGPAALDGNTTTTGRDAVSCTPVPTPP